MENSPAKPLYIIGMSPGNSYFKDEEIKYLLKTTVEKHGRVVVMIADVPAVSTYIALGYKENIARREKAMPQGNLLRNKTKRAMVQLGYDDTQVIIVDWMKEVESNTDYQREYKKIKDLYESNVQFNKDSDTTTLQVLEGSKRAFNDISQATKIAVHYLLSEIAFIEWVPQFFKVSKIVYIYHKNWSIFENYIAGKYDGISKKHLDFRLLENPWETYKSRWGAEDEENNSYTTGLERVEKTKVLRVAFSNYPPALMYNHEDDAFFGIFYEVVVAIAKKYGWEIKWSEETGYGVIIDGLEHNRFDIFGSTVWPTPERKQKASFSVSLYTSKAYIWSLPGFDYENRKDSPDLRVVIKENDISHSIAVADFPNARLVYVPQLSDPQDLLQFVTEDKGDITFVEPYLAEQFMKKTGAKLVQANNIPIRTYDNTFVFKKDDQSLKVLFDKEIVEMMQKGIIQELINKYTGNTETFS
ncbi:MAG: hypothetical protein RL641_765 [Candidatus Parcubacteria bacterium]